MNKYLKKIIYAATVFFVPSLSFAQSGGGSGRTIMQILDYVAEIINSVIPVLIGIAVVVFLFGVFKYIFTGDPKGKKEALPFITWGLIALFVMIALWGFVNLLQQTVFRGGDPSGMGESAEAIRALETNPTQEKGGGLVGPVNNSGINQTIVAAMNIVGDAIPLLISLGIVLFLWGVFKYISSDSAKLKSEAVAFMTWGVIVLLVIGTVWGFVKMIADSTDISIESQPNLGEGTVSPGELIIK